MEKLKQRSSRSAAHAASNKGFFGIRGRLLLLVAAAMAPLIGLGVLNIRQQLGVARSIQVERAFNRARLTATLVDNQLGGVDTLLRSLASLISTDPRDIDKNQALLQSVQGNLPLMYLNLRAFTADGQPLGDTEGKRELTDRDRSFIQASLTRRGLAPDASPVTLAEGKYALTIARAVLARDGTAVAALATMIDLDELQKVLDNSAQPDGTVVTLVNERQTILARSRDSQQWIGRDATNMSAIADARDRPETSSTVPSLSPQPRPSVGVLAYAPCRLAPWRVYVSAQGTDAPTALQEEFGSTVLIGVSTITAALMFAWLVAGRITKPILQLAADAKIFSTGDSSHRTRVVSKSEVGLLARTFNRMLDALQRRDAALRSSESRYRTLIDNAPEAIVVFDMETGSFVDHNLEAERLFKMDREALRKGGPLAVSPILQPDGRASVEAATSFLNQAVAGDIPVFEWMHQDSAGREIPCEIRLLRLPSEDRVLVRGSITSISDRKQAEQRLAQTLALQRAILDQAGYAIISTTPEGIITTFNPAAERLLGYAASEVIGRHAAQLIHDPEEIGARTEALSSELGRMIAPGFEVFMARARASAPGEQEWTYIRKDGSRVPVQLAVTTLSDTAGQTTGFIGMAIDITERRQAEQQLAHERTVLELIARGTPLNVVLNMLLKGHEGLFPATLGSVMLLDSSGKRFARSVSPSLPSEYLTAMEGTIIGPAVGSCGTAAFTGKTIIVTDISTDPRWDDYRQLALQHGLRACWSAPIRAGSGAVLGTFALYYREPREPQSQELAAIASSAQLAGLAIERRQADVARGELERKLLETQKLESLGVLAGGIAHDFNNLLTGILGNASLAALELPRGSPIHDYLEQINQSSMRAADLCKQMLAYSGKGRFIVEKINLNRLVEETAHLLNLSISKRAKLQFHLAPDVAPIEADATQIRQVVMNLVINASEAIGDRAGTITITTGLKVANKDYLGGTVTSPDLPEGKYVSLEISDDGSGMSPETQARIFDPFYSTKFTGRGLGLAAVLGIMRGHGGALKVKSKVGHGTTFQLLLPCVGGRAEERSPATVVRPAWQGKGTVLVVDDEEAIRKMGGRMLQSLGFETVLVGDGREAVNLFRETPGRFAMVLLDLTMPVMDGEQTFTELRRLKPDVRVILMSGFNRQESVARFMGRGLASFLQKPFTLDTMQEVVQSVWDGAI